MKVKNIRGDRRTCRCGSWIAHWRNCTGSKKRKCANRNCTNTKYYKLYGAHVRKDGRDKTEYIVPLCPACNHFSKANKLFEIGNTPLVRSNKQETCKQGKCKIG